MTVAATTYVMGQMVENYKQHKALVDSFEWYFLPVANPDGFVFTHTQVFIVTKIKMKVSITSQRLFSTLTHIL